MNDTTNREVEIEKVEAYCNKKGWTLLEYCEMFKAYKVKTEMVLPRFLEWDGSRLVAPDPH